MRTLAFLFCLLVAAGCREQEIQGPPPVDHGEAPDPATDPLAARLFALGQERAPTYHPEQDMFRGRLARGQVQDHPVVLIGTHCYVGLATGDEGVEELDLTLVDPRGAPMLRDDTTGPAATFGLRHPVCPPSPGTYRVRVRVAAGEGDYALRLFSTSML